MRLFLFTVTFLFFTLNSFGQLGEVKVEVKDGEKMYVHTVQKGNTLWGLYKQYDVAVEKIIEKNPGIENGLKEGQVVYIPVPIITETKVHVVEAGETLYSIARKYDVTTNDIESWNPSLSAELKIGQQVKILVATYATGDKALPVTPQENKAKEVTPPIRVTFNDSIVEHQVTDGETLYSISKRYMVSIDKIVAFNNKKSTVVKPGEIIKIPLKKERITNVAVREVPQKDVGPSQNKPVYSSKGEYKIAILLPFMLNRGAGYSDRIATMSTEFLMGAQMALDSLESLGLKAKVFVYDIENNESKVKEVLAKPELATMDMVIGPLNKAFASLVADWCLRNKIRMVCPVNVDTKILQNNPYVYASMGSDITLEKGLARFVAQKFNGDNVILIKPTNAKDSALYQAFRSEYKQFTGAGKGKLIETTLDNFSTFVARNMKLAIVFPTNDAKSAIKFMGEISKLGNKFGSDSYIFGTDAWLDMDGINALYRNNYRVSVPSSMDLNYTYDRTKFYHRKYRTLYGSDFTKVAIQGYDVIFNYVYELLMGKNAGQLIMNNFDSKQIGGNHGYENKNVEILTHENFDLINISKGL
ncbi:MAG: LysM peptidoglycan-binding domain-containing protein [Crocinitomicaceae bacterium]|nr:LysM peptidoglycan-binding domain-containing protein [Crocinitomicaceae bacterium]